MQTGSVIIQPKPKSTLAKGFQDRERLGSQVNLENDPIA